MQDEILIVGGGIGGLTLALELHRLGMPCRIFESAPGIKAVGVGINILPHANQVLCELGLEPALAKVAVETQEAAFFNRFGQLIYKEALGRRAGYQWPQFSIHRGDLQAVLLEAVQQRIGAERLHLGWHCLGFEQGEAAVTLRFRDRHAPFRCESLLQHPSTHVAHHHIRLARAEYTEAINRDDVRVIDVGGGARRAHEADASGR
jgi:2-polyprenyl-6-methoxyphenol hydroxylase-like FAD-dependent oxidoreductase